MLCETFIGDAQSDKQTSKLLLLDYSPACLQPGPGLGKYRNLNQIRNVQLRVGKKKKKAGSRSFLVQTPFSLSLPDPFILNFI